MLDYPEHNKRTMAIDWAKIYQKYRGLWIALKDDEKEVIASGKSIDEVMNKSKIKGYKLPILHRVPTKDAAYIGRNLCG